MDMDTRMFMAQDMDMGMDADMDRKHEPRDRHGYFDIYLKSFIEIHYRRTFWESKLSTINGNRGLKLFAAFKK